MKKLFKESILPFLPILLIHLVVVLFFSPEGLKGDAVRYMNYAENLTQGFYADFEDPSIRNGPGYPLCLTLPVILKAPYIVIRLMNIAFLAVALVYFLKTLSRFLKRKYAIILCYALGLYPALVRASTRIISELFTILLVCGFLYYFVRLIKSSKPTKKDIILSSIFLAGVALTKIIFGYVIITLLIFSLLIFVFKRTQKLKAGILTLFFALLICTPYLAYTYSITQKVFTWGTHGGEMLYWRATPFENEYGDWISHGIILNGDDGTYCDAEALRENHGKFLEHAYTLSALERDVLFKEKALDNMKNHPKKYAHNTLASAFRLFFNYPYTYIPLKPSSYFYQIPNSFLVIFLLMAMLLAAFNLRKLTFEISFLGVFALIFLGGIILLDGRVRHLIAIIPVLIFVIASIFYKFLHIKFQALESST